MMLKQFNTVVEGSLALTLHQMPIPELPELPVVEGFRFESTTSYEDTVVLTLLIGKALSAKLASRRPNLPERRSRSGA